MEREKTWKKYWSERSSYSDYKIAHGRGAYPDSVFASIGDDIDKFLSFEDGDTILDLGGGTGHFIKQLDSERFTSLTLVEPYANYVNNFNKWARKTGNSHKMEAIQDSLPHLSNLEGKKFNKIICGAVFPYLNDAGLQTSMENIYNLLEEGGKALVYHGYDIEKRENEGNERAREWNVLWMKYGDIAKIAKDVGFTTCERVTVGENHGYCCGSVEVSFLVTKETGATQKRSDLEILDEVQEIRSKNNVNWMDILRLAFTHAPTEARKLMGRVNEHDGRISALLSELAGNE
tara:strand:- start:3249 stop:4118 length:870 start_codon:yes stop_codon:yes gene_type:complete